MSLQFIERLEEGGKINSGERIRLKDLLENVDGNPKARDMVEDMKKEFKRLKVAENREEPFMEETKAYFIGNGDSRSRYNN